MVSAIIATAAQTQANPISFHFWTFAFQVINVLVVLYFLSKLLFKPLGNLMVQREKQVTDAMDKAAVVQAEADKLLAEYEKRLATAQDEVQEILAKAAQKADEYQQQRQKDANVDYEKRLAQAKMEIAAEKQQALKEMRDEIARLVVLAAGKVVGQVLREEDHQHLVDDYVAKVGELN